MDRTILFILAALQTVAWALDVIENCMLLSWIDKRVIDEEFGTFHFIVATKWIIALSGALGAIVTLLVNRRTKRHRN